MLSAVCLREEFLCGIGTEHGKQKKYSEFN